MDLIIRVEGSVQANNIVEFEQNALAIIENINANLQTDADFGEAEDNIKYCKGIEDKIWQSKQDAIMSIAGVNDLFQLMDRLHDKFRNVRLDLGKKIKTEKTNRRNEIIKDAHTVINGMIGETQIQHGFTVPPGIFEDSIKGKRSFDSMVDAIDDVIYELKNELNTLNELFNKNILSVVDAEKEYPGLFSDKMTICLKPENEVFAIITGRISDFKLKIIEKEKAKKDELERRAAADKIKDIVLSEDDKTEPADEIILDAELQKTTQPVKMRHRIEFTFTGISEDADRLGEKICKLFPAIGGYRVL